MAETAPHLSREELEKQKVLSGGGEVGALMRAKDWSKTPLGPVANWPQSLRTAVSLCLHSRFELFIWWGPELVILYNDAYRQTLQSKHPKALGKPGRKVWHEIWQVIGPMLEHVMRTGEATFSEDLLLFIERHGYPEETYHTFSYSPILNETGDIGGVFTAVAQTTEKVIGERRLRTLRELASRSADAATESEAWKSVADVLRENPYDVQFAALYCLDPKGDAEAVSFAGIAPDHPFLPPRIAHGDQDHPCGKWIFEAVGSGKSVEVRDAHELGFHLPGGAWNEEPSELIFIPLVQTGQAQPLGVIVAGVSRRKRLDESYRGFFNILASQISKSISDAQAFEKERKRAEALAEIDRAKTAFFSNVSHEFRTPLTLMLGPLEDTLAEGREMIGEENAERLETVHRNGLRLLKLVNMLLDFSRIEAGRVKAAYEPVDLSALTAQLASVFRSAVERAGMYLEVNCDPIAEAVYVDRDMWEKIVFNLLSNAFKFTFSGGIKVQLKELASEVHLIVSDTGTGIPEEEQARLFERFHRVEGAKGRSFEGSGIGLALVQELARQHGGSVSVTSTLGKGSRFTVSIPRGKAHLAPERIGASRNLNTNLLSESYVEEVIRWLPNEMNAASEEERAEESTDRPTVVLADDNADMRDYVYKLLRSEYKVLLATNGQEALQHVRDHRPDLVLTDVMMPVLDGFGLLKSIRMDDAIAATPIIMLSARAGEEARVEGLQAGADDYLVKPFTARELMARVASHLTIARARREAAEKERRLLAIAETERRKLRDLFEQAPAGIGMLSGPDHVWTYVNPVYVNMVGRSSAQKLLNRPLAESMPELAHQGFVEVLDEVYRTGQRYVGIETLARLGKDANHLRDAYFDFVYEPMRAATGEIEGILVHCVEVTDRVRARRELELELVRRHQIEVELEKQRSFLAMAQKSAHVGSWQIDLTAKKRRAIFSEELEHLYGYETGAFGGSYDRWVEVLHPDDRAEVSRSVERALESREPWACEFRIVRQDGAVRWMSGRGQSFYDESGKPTRMIGINIDVTDRKLAEEALRNSEKLAATGRLAATIAHEINNPLEAVGNLIFLVQQAEGLDEATKNYLVMADQELERVTHIARQTLGFYRDTSLPVTVNIRESLRDVLRLFERKLKYKSLTADLRAPEKLEIDALQGEIRQVLSNLLTNAMDASPNGSVISLRARRLWRHGEEFARITVADHGHGIGAGLQQNIFTPFFTTKKDVGTGLGLWVTKSMIEKHGGRIRFRSRAGRGTVFTVLLPKSHISHPA
jgi:PAS domain S-box-containing protein